MAASQTIPIRRRRSHSTLASAVHASVEPTRFELSRKAFATYAPRQPQEQKRKNEA